MLIGGLVKLIIYNIIPRTHAPTLLVHYDKHGKRVKGVLKTFLANLKAHEIEDAPTWLILFETIKRVHPQIAFIDFLMTCINLDVNSSIIISGV